MSTEAAAHTNGTGAHAGSYVDESIGDKGKGKFVDEHMDEDGIDEDDEDDEEEEEEDEDEDMAEEESLDEIDPSVIQPRRTRGVRVDYTSPEALAKAGVTQEADEPEDDGEDTYEAQDESMRD